MAKKAGEARSRIEHAHGEPEKRRNAAQSELSESEMQWSGGSGRVGAGANGQASINLQVGVAWRVVDRQVARGTRGQGDACVPHFNLQSC